jgi:hypothetical protein
MPFYFKINKIKIIDNKESGFLFFHKDLANINLDNFFTTSDVVFPKLDKYISYATAKDDRSKEIAIADMVVDTIRNRTTIQIDCVKDNQILTFGDTGCALYRSGTIPNDIGWCLIAIESDKEIRKIGTTIDEVINHPAFKIFATSFAGLIGLSSTPAFSASLAVIKYIGQQIATSMKNNKDDMVGLINMSLNRWEHYPNGERKSEGISDLTGNMLVDYSIFGFDDQAKICFPPKRIP